MLNVKYFEDLSIKFSQLMKSSPAGDLQDNIRALLEGAFTKLELVTREEYDVQADVLRNANEKLIKLEAKLTQLESLLQKEHK